MKDDVGRTTRVGEHDNPFLFRPLTVVGTCTLKLGSTWMSGAQSPHRSFCDGLCLFNF
jgi:hypothetical protein